MNPKISRRAFVALGIGGGTGAAHGAGSPNSSSEAKFAPELFFADQIPNGFTWTLASRLGDMLHLAEELFGPRDKSFTILGVEIGPDVPRLWYPGNRGSVVVQLAPSAVAGMSRACYQLAHEAVHLLAPNGGGSAVNLEEGVACYFAELYMRKQFGEPHWRPEIPSYVRALSMVRARLDRDARCVRRLRDKSMSFSGIADGDLSREFPDLDPAARRFLLSSFVRDDAGKPPASIK